MFHTNVNQYTVKHSQLFIAYFYLITGPSVTCFGVKICHHQAVTPTIVLLNDTVPLGSNATT
jgi:hypothetical protein